MKHVHCSVAAWKLGWGILANPCYASFSTLKYKYMFVICILPYFWANIRVIRTDLVFWG